MVDKELIENWRNMLKPSISSWLFKTNYEGMGEQDKEEFGRDFDEILDLALIGLKYKAQLFQERTDKRTETHACDLISRQAAIDAVNRAVTQEVARWSLQELPSAQTEHKKGKWIQTNPLGRSDNIVCDQCGYDSIAEFIYCPNCGAKMEESDEGE